MRRRGIFGMLAGAFTAGPAAAKTALEGIGPEWLMPRPMDIESLTEPAQSAAGLYAKWRLPDGPLRAIAESVFNRRNQEQEIVGAIERKLGPGYDPDIAANGSWSPAYRAHIQAERIRGDYETVFALRERLWGH